ncbi:MAG: flagellar FlbD family protein [Lachnospiraceae bacterium]|uniref:flagellar FlbD family protein n=1 Tax=Falcatimonas sp. MSJ-15 TaxID=2841515 RepID=UPI001C1183BC|nr:flagellar FlbD family protein [Falcatimonas sp. MSJ-15]MBQ5734092.1 flagellar FlbD family protein [Lachnospiraceae bacterium]MBU5469663.1 flagellar FlbD family protein [Falcatimonas sp. MSJ-15]MEE0959011.1 flagellar FlbD family protein [Lachnospiraceae bacterium]
MVELTRFNDTRFLINTELIEMVEETPDTVVTLTTGKKLIVKESKEDIKNKVIAYKKEIFSNLLKV